MRSALVATPGMGLRLLTPVGPLRFDVAYSWDKLQRGTVYVSNSETEDLTELRPVPGGPPLTFQPSSPGRLAAQPDGGAAVLSAARRAGPRAAGRRRDRVARGRDRGAHGDAARARAAGAERVTPAGDAAPGPGARGRHRGLVPARPGADQCGGARHLGRAAGVAAGGAGEATSSRTSCAKRFILETLEVDHPVINLVRHASGRWNYEEVLRLSEGPPGQKSTPPLIEFRNMKLTDGALSLAYPWPTGNMTPTRAGGAGAARCARSRDGSWMDTPEGTKRIMTFSNLTTRDQAAPYLDARSPAAAGGDRHARAPTRASRSCSCASCRARSSRRATRSSSR